MQYEALDVMLLGENCTHDNECSSHLMCSAQTCACMPGYRKVKDWCEPTKMADGTGRVRPVYACVCVCISAHGSCLCHRTNG
ncbi:hypothetical protein HPB48_015429 [Haemaphysalis longicornis]|uniref:EB domain-containing protein n=1 Tax=Haemaphysalis longicornis TaxID=44386 RepID=A0A9J6GAP6_HAELO|nr:hypothetical protein HPB48_015429 [Haemaphysalis longicornis]